ncbi:MAG: GAF domain-containing protein [Candidatus Marinimicrobia bacterium]|nr:GAF domain-containing protein [Candidatus Neomarinimicrobiota bacterium]
MISLEFLQKFSSLLQKSLSRAETYAAVFDILDETIEYDSASLFVVSQHSDELEEAFTRGPAKVDLVSEVAFSQGGGLSGWVAGQKFPFIFPELSDEGGKRDFKSLVSIPLWIESKLLGVLNLGHKEAGHFKPDDQHGFEQLALELAIILEQLALRTEVQEKNQQLEALLKELQEAQQVQIEKERLAAIGEVVVKINHEINNPLAIIISVADLMDIKASEEHPEFCESLAKVKAAAYRIRDLARALENLESSQVEEYVGGVSMLKID